MIPPSPRYGGERGGGPRATSTDRFCCIPALRPTCHSEGALATEESPRGRRRWNFGRPVVRARSAGPRSLGRLGSLGMTIVVARKTRERARSDSPRHSPLSPTLSPAYRREGAEASLINHHSSHRVADLANRF